MFVFLLFYHRKLAVRSIHIISPFMLGLHVSLCHYQMHGSLNALKDVHLLWLVGLEWLLVCLFPALLRNGSKTVRHPFNCCLKTKEHFVYVMIILSKFSLNDRRFTARLGSSCLLTALCLLFYGGIVDNSMDDDS